MRRSNKNARDLFIITKKKENEREKTVVNSIRNNYQFIKS